MNYTELVSAIGGFMNRTDLTASIPTFIMLAEAQFKRDIRVKRMEIPLAETIIVDNEITLPAGVVDVKDLWIADREPMTRAPLNAVLTSRLYGIPTMYARKGESGLFFNGGGSVQGVVYQEIPSLTDVAPNNWLADEFPGVYLYRALVEAQIFTGGDPSRYEAQYAQALSSLQGSDNRHTGPLVMRAR